MASDGVPINASVTSLVQVSQTTTTGNPASGKPLPANGNHAAAQPNQANSSRPPAAKPPTDLHAVAAQLNKLPQSSGRPTKYRLDSSSGRQVIQEINPDTREVVGELPANEFKALAQELGISGLLVDTRA